MADWLRTWAGPRIEEFVEIEAYHLEQSVRLQRELEGSADPAVLDQAVAALESSSRRASLLDDSRATRAFAERALALRPDSDVQRMELEALLADALWRLGEFRQAADIAAPLELEAAAAGRKDLQGRAIVIRAGDVWVSLESTDADRALIELRRARKLLTGAGDDRTLIDVLTWIGWGGWWHGHMEDCEEAWEEFRRIAHEHGWLSREAEALTLLARSWIYRNDPERVMSLLDEAAQLAQRGTSRLARARVERVTASHIEQSGAPGEPDPWQRASALMASSMAVFEEFGEILEQQIALVHLGDIEDRRGNPRRALDYFEQAMPLVKDHAGYRPETQRRLAQTQLALGDVESAERNAEEALATVAHDDTFTVGTTSMAMGLVREAQGNLAEAERLLSSAVEVMIGTEIQRSRDLPGAGAVSVPPRTSRRGRRGGRGEPGPGTQVWPVLTHRHVGRPAACRGPRSFARRLRRIHAGPSRWRFLPNAEPVCIVFP